MVLKELPTLEAIPLRNEAIPYHRASLVGGFSRHPNLKNDGVRQWG